LELSGGIGVKSNDAKIVGSSPGFGSVAEGAAKPDLKDPSVVLSLLEADQVVAAKQKTRFGRRNLSLGVQMLLWGLRIYVVAMLVLVVVSVLRAVHTMH
jgi:hypothetical protein